MNCDIAFDLMTDPQGASSQALRQHLAECARCRAMQDTMAPALDGLAIAALPDGERPARMHDRPWNRSTASLPGFAPTEAIAIAEQAAAALAGSKSPTSTPITATRRRLTRVLQSAAFIALGGLFTLALIPAYRPAVDPGSRSGCRRQEAASIPAGGRTAAEVRALIAACATCHGKLPVREPEAGRLGRNTLWDIAQEEEFTLLRSFLRQAAQSTACPQNDIAPEGRLLCRGLQPLDADIPELDRIGVPGEPEEPRFAVFARVGRVIHELGDLAQVAVQNRHAVQLDLYG